MQPSRISFSAFVICILAAFPAFCSTVKGLVQIESASTHSFSLADVVVWLDSSTSPPPTEKREHARLLQKDKTFSPHVLVVQTGTIVDFPNDDPIFHNAFSTYDGQVFDVGLYPPGTNRSVRFRRPGVVRVFCNIHPSMSALIVVVDSRYYTKASPKGEYRFADVPTGSYRVNVYDERATAAQPGQVPIEVSGNDQEVTPPVIRVSEAGYLRAPHKNKYGLDYPPGSNDPGYDGVMK